MRNALILLVVTALLVAVGCAFYVVGYAGFGQFLWVLASGTAGAAIMSGLDSNE